MGDLAVAILGIVLVNQYVLARVPGSLGEPDTRTADPGSAGAILLLLVPSVAISWFIRASVLEPMDLPELRFLVLVLVLGVLATLVAPTLGRAIPGMGAHFAASPIRLTFNAVALGAAVLATREPGSLAAAVGWSLGAGVGFALLDACFAALRARLDLADLPGPLHGEAIALVTAAIVCLGLGGLAGLLR